MKLSLLPPVLAAIAIVLASCGKKQETAAPASSAPTPSAEKAAPTPATPATPTPAAPSNPATPPIPRALAEKLIGKWLRGDGDYLIEIRTIDDQGKLNAAYFNPNGPINVSRAEAKFEDNTAKVMIELRDTGYPNCIYTLAYDSKVDQLFGLYYQAAQQQTYDVAFGRMKNEQ